MQGHTIVCGDDALAMRIVEELNNAGTSVVMLQNPGGLAEAGIANAEAVICADDDDDLTAPSVVEACLGRTTHTISAAGIDFVVSGTDAPHDATLREMYGALAPV